jgi:hypothetical protein
MCIIKGKGPFSVMYDIYDDCVVYPVNLSMYNVVYSDGHTFVYSLLRYRYRYIISNGRY